jgi:hypothetical protein
MKEKVGQPVGSADLAADAVHARGGCGASTDCAEGRAVLPRRPNSLQKKSCQAPDLRAASGEMSAKQPLRPTGKKVSVSFTPGCAAGQSNCCQRRNKVSTLPVDLPNRSLRIQNCALQRADRRNR